MTFKSFEIRAGVLDDAASLQAYMTNLVSENLPVLFRKERPPTLEEERLFIGKLLSESNSILLVAVVDDEVIGVLDFHGGKGQRSHGGEFGMAVAKPWRRRGVATALVSRLLAWAGENGIRRVGLQVFQNNSPAIRFYERLGFSHEGRLVEAIELDGKFIDLLQMSKLVDQP